MSFATSTEPPTRMRAGDSSALRPWQFFLLAGMLGATAAVVVATGQSMPSIVALSLTVVAASMAGLGLYRTLAPLVGPETVRAARVDARLRAGLEREKTLVLRAIKDLEFDRAMGKIAPADFDEMAGRLRGRAVELIQQLDGAGAYKDRIEAELAARLARAPRTHAPATPPPAAAVERRCAACDAANDRDARFCKSCGARLEAA